MRFYFFLCIWVRTILFSACMLLHFLTSFYTFIFEITVEAKLKKCIITGSKNWLATTLSSYVKFLWHIFTWAFRQFDNEEHDSWFCCALQPYGLPSFMALYQIIGVIIVLFWFFLCTENFPLILAYVIWTIYIRKNYIPGVNFIKNNVVY